MKNQYIGDIGDYGKYGLIRFFRDAGIKIGINWYLTPNDNRTDGNHTEYLYDERMRIYDEKVFDAMKELAFRSDKCIQMVEENGILDGICFYNNEMNFDQYHWSERTNKRYRWHLQALDILRNVDLVFMDPDNSLSLTKKATQKGAQKYILPIEICDYYNRGQQIVYYHHRSRSNETGWMKEKTQIKTFLPEACLLAVTFHRWSSRTYIFVLQKEKFELYKQIINRFLSSEWGTTKIDGKASFSIETI